MPLNNIKFSKRGFWSSFVIVITFLFSVYGRGVLKPVFDSQFIISQLNTFYFYLWWIVPTITIIIILYGKDVLRILGLDKSVFKALIFAVICTLPMFLSSFVMGTFNSGITFTEVIKKSLGPGIMEEFLFRGFLFGLLFYKIKWGFIPAALLGAIVFAIEHLYQGNGIGHSIGVFLVTAVGAVWFSWLYAEWNKNLWIPVFLHMLMNLSWLLFEVSPDALGGFNANIFRGVTIALSILMTIYYHKKRGFVIRKHNLIVNNTMN